MKMDNDSKEPVKLTMRVTRRPAPKGKKIPSKPTGIRLVPHEPVGKGLIARFASLDTEQQGAVIKTGVWGLFWLYDAFVNNLARRVVNEIERRKGW